MKQYLLYFCILVCWIQIQAAKECYKDGLFCESCTSLVHCSQDENGNWEKTARQSCGFKKCVNGTCTKDDEPICDGVADIHFPCKNVGIFPHPYYCNKFVLCVDDWGLKPFVNNCEEGYGYDIASKTCKIKLTAKQCPELSYPVPECANLLESAPLAKDKNIYYTCEKVHQDLFHQVLYPVLRQCPHGETYDAKNLCH